MKQVFKKNCKVINFFMSQEKNICKILSNKMIFRSICMSLYCIKPLRFSTLREQVKASQRVYQ